MLCLPTTLPSPVDEPPASGALYDPAPMVKSSARRWRLRPGGREERYRRLARKP
jgi:hypothetical protein